MPFVRRYTYDPDEILGPKRFRIDGRLFERVDLEVFPAHRPSSKDFECMVPGVEDRIHRLNMMCVFGDDWQVLNKRRQRLKCSHYMPVIEGGRQQAKYVCSLWIANLKKNDV